MDGSSARATSGRSAETRPHCAEPKRPCYISDYRAVGAIGTNIAILAVDFFIYPRRLAKTENYGFSVMDGGVGFFTLAGGMVSKAARGSRAPTSLRVTAYSLWPLLLLGAIRLILVWGVDYHVPTSEYGVHWNFFFSIALVTLGSSLVVNRLFPAEWADAAGLIIAAVYELVLNCGVGGFILNAERTSFFSANREGILGSIGLLSLFLIGVGHGRILKPERAPPTRITLTKLLGWCVVTFLLVVYLDKRWGLMPSRRLSNLPFVLLCVSHHSWQLACCLAANLFIGSRQRIFILDGVQKNMLAIFLLANQLTGMVNVTMQTLLQPPATAFAILVLYCIVWSGVSYALACRHVALKFW